MIMKKYNSKLKRKKKIIQNILEDFLVYDIKNFVYFIIDKSVVFRIMIYEI